MIVGGIATFVVVLVGMIIFAAVTSTSDSTTSASDSGSGSVASTSTATPAAPSGPTDEAAFLASKAAAESRFDDAPNDMVKHQIAGAWRNGGTCSALTTARFSNWIGTMAKIEYNGDLYIDLGDDVTLDASIDKASPLFKVVSALKEGDTVEVSGNFAPTLINRISSGGLPKCMAPPLTDNLVDEDSGTVKTPHFNVTLSRLVPQTQ